MAKTKISEYSSTSAGANLNTDIASINIDEGCSPANINNAIRALMAQVKDLQSGASGDTIPVTAGGTGSANASSARSALSAAKSGANSDITSITGLTTPLSVSQGGTGYTTNATISSVGRTSNVVTINTTSAHGFVTGDTVTVTAGTNTSINGAYTITDTPTSTSFTYSLAGTNISTVSDTGTAVTSSQRYVSLTSNVSGTLPMSKGGTGVTSFVKNALLLGNNTSAISTLKPSTNGKVVTSKAGSSVSNNSFVVGVEYTISNLGTTTNTEWNTIAGTSSVTYAVGSVFTAAVTGSGSGDGAATENVFSMESIPSATISRGTLVTTTSGATADFTDIPSWVKRITVMFNGVSVSATSRIQIQLGTSSGLVTSGYVSITTDKSGTSVTSTGGLLVTQNTDATSAYSGVAIITNITSNTWVMSSSLFSVTNSHCSYSGGNIALGGTLDKLTVLPVTGAVNFDAGSINILYE